MWYGAEILRRVGPKCRLPASDRNESLSSRKGRNGGGPFSYPFMMLFPILVIIYWAVPYTREQSNFHLVSHCDGCSTKCLPFFEAL
jgi:hypothetical protein